MSHRHPRRPSRLRTVGVLAAATMLTLSACGGGGSSSAGSDDYVVGVSAGITGAFAAITKGEITGMQAYFDQVNEAGGVHGRDIRLVTADSQGVATTAVGTLTKIATTEKPVVVLGDTGGNTCLAQTAVAQKYTFPILCAQLAAEKLKPSVPYLYAMYGTQLTELDAFEATIADVAKLTDPKVAMVYLSSNTSQPFFDELGARLEQSGAEIVLDEPMTAVNLDLGVQADKVRQSGAEVVVTQIIPQQMESFAGAMRQAGTDIPIVSEASTASYQSMLTQKNPNLLQLALNPFIDPSLDTPAMTDYVDSLGSTADLTTPEELNGQSIAIAYAAAAFIVEALETCGEDCDGESMNEAMEQSSVDLPGVNQDFSFAPDRHYAPTQFLLYQWSDKTQSIETVVEDLPANEIP